MNADIDIIATHGAVDQGLDSLRHREWIALCEQGKDYTQAYPSSPIEQKSWPPIFEENIVETSITILPAEAIHQGK